MTITGLAHSAVVRFGGAAGTITANSGTRITVTSPPSIGTADVTTPAVSRADSARCLHGHQG